MRYIKKVSTAPLIEGRVSNTLNVQDKETNAPSIRLMEEVTADVYSTEEQVIGKWIDGKPLYRKVVNFGGLPNASTRSVSYTVENLSKITNYYGIARVPSTGTTVKLPFASNSGNTGNIQVVLTPDSITIITGVDRASFTETYIILEYTKTTE